MGAKGQIFLTKLPQIINVEGMREVGKRHWNPTVIFTEGKFHEWMLKVVVKALRRDRTLA